MQLIAKLKNCPPAMFYLGFSLVGTLYFYIFNSVAEPLFPLFNYKYYTAFQLVFLFFWTWVLTQLCDKMSVFVSWFLVFLPNIFLILQIINVFKGQIIL